MTIKIKKLKPKNKKVKSSKGLKNQNCPYCGSKLITNNLGVIECSSTNLGLWSETFEKYDLMNEDQKASHLGLYADPTSFIELYAMWGEIGEDGLKLELRCPYTNVLYNPISRPREITPDPIVVALIEKDLKRLLSEEERRNEGDIWREGKRYFEDYKKGRKKVKIPLLQFPTDFL